MRCAENRLLWAALGGGSAAALGALVLLRPYQFLGYPVERGSDLRLTPAGNYGAARKGPPAHSHQGIDIVAESGAAVTAVGHGVLIAAVPGRGKTVLKLRLDEPGKWQCGAEVVDFVVYADLGTALAQPGDRVRRGQTIATVAAEGFVHFAVKQRLGNTESFIDPHRSGLLYRRADGTVQPP